MEKNTKDKIYYIPTKIVEDFLYKKNNMFKFIDYNDKFKKLLVDEKSLDRYCKICLLVNKEPILKDDINFLMQYIVRDEFLLEDFLVEELKDTIYNEIILSMGIPKKYFNK